MAGYSGTPLARKLGIKAGASVALFHAPRGFETLLEGLPDGVAITREPAAAGPFDVLVCFVQSVAELQAGWKRWRPRLAVAGGLWIAWPKRASKVATDVTEDSVRQSGLASGLVDNKVCAIDATWSGLRFVIRLEDRPSKARRNER